MFDFKKLEQRATSSFGPDPPIVLVNLQVDSGSVQRRFEKLQQDRNPNPATCFQVWKKTNHLKRSCGKLQEGNVGDRSGSCGELQQGLEIQLETTGLDCHDPQVTDYECVEKVFKNLRRKLSRSKKDETFLTRRPVY